ncbi:MAG: hypothetical protein HYY50_01495 [Candidatus Kerfeldbacteria bacterium]|nr:hypothetical protein [Candidatus Kerfeldbacteria bacterium]
MSKKLVQIGAMSGLTTLAVLALALSSGWGGRPPTASAAHIPYVEPDGPPPQSVPQRTLQGYNQPLEFLNASSASQLKRGSLLIGESSGSVSDCTDPASSDPDKTRGCSRWCLNSDQSLWTTDVNNCIRTWQQLPLVGGGPFLRLLDETGLSQVDRGVVVLLGRNTENQFKTLVAEANPAASGSVGIGARSTSTSHYAAEFAGRVLVNNSSGDAKLCLNGNDSTHCIATWQGAIESGFPPETVRLRNATPWSVQDSPGGLPGNVGLNGPLIVGSLVVGTPAGPLLCGAAPCSCGDGLCSTVSNENSATCAADCPP